MFNESDSYRFELYHPAKIVEESHNLRDESRTDGDVRDLFTLPGLGVDPELALLIGDLGADMPIALDYRRHGLAPRVIYLGSRGWVEVADDFDAFSEMISDQLPGPFGERGSE
ncbi:hypothetical protein [Streptomyces sp. CAU 1734]|uniref:hypothetical protein n=1 Tax=Streptomyces sp. CAU 1734 TaxID=3140360 RepID=UPI003260DC20